MLELALLTLLAAIPITVSPETTIVIEPLADDGLPDFGEAFLKRSGKGCDPRDNGAIPFWKAVGLQDLSIKERVLLIRELRCEVPRSRETLKPLPKQVRGNPQVPVQDDAVVRALSSRPWSKSTRDSLGGWINANRLGLDWLVEAGNRPAFYSPAPCLLKEDPEPLINVALFDAMAMREYGHYLLLEAMHAASLGDLAACNAAIGGAHGLSHHFLRSPTGLGLLVGFTYSRASNRSTLATLGGLNQKALKRLIETTEERLARTSSCEKHFGENDLLLTVDAVVRELSGRQVIKLQMDRGDQIHKLGDRFRDQVDPNEALRVLAYHGKEINRIASMRDRVARRKRWIDLAAAIEAVNPAVAKEKALAEGASPAEANGVVVGTVFTQLMLPASDYVFLAGDSALSLERLTAIAAALRLFRLQHNEYPESLNAVSQDLRATTLSDPFTNQPFRYERRGDGFLLYSLGANGQDDGGSDRLGDFVRGEHAPVDWGGDREAPEGPDDIVVRLPIPLLELPGSVPKAAPSQ